MTPNTKFKKQMLKIELNYLQLLCIQEIVNSIEHVYSKEKKLWPVAARAWQIEASEVISEVLDAQLVTQLIPTTIAAKLVPKGYPKETFDFIDRLNKDPKRYEALLKEYVPNRAVSDEKLLFFSSKILSFLNDVHRLLDFFTYEKPLYWKKLFKRNEANYFLGVLHRFLTTLKISEDHGHYG